MGIVLDFDARNNILRVALEGRLTDAMLLDISEAVARVTKSHLAFRGIADTTNVTEYEVSSDGIRRIAALLPSSPAANLWIAITPMDHAYGMTRMFQMLSEKDHPNFHVVRTLDEAYRLLDVKSPEFSPIS